MTKTFPEKMGLIWDEFQGHSATVVKEYYLSLPFLILKLFLTVSPLLLNLLIELLTRLGEQGRKNTAPVGALICFGYMGM